MKIISIDVGIKNLALCCFEKKEGDEFFQIKQWDIVNIGEKETLLCQVVEKEKEKEKTKSKQKTKSKAKINTNTNTKTKTEEDSTNEIICGKPAKFTKNNECFCLKHAKKTSFLIPTSDLKPSFIHKQKVQKLFEMADQYHISYDSKTKKADLISLLNEYADNTCLEPIGVVNASKVDIISIGKNIQTKLDELFYTPLNIYNQLNGNPPKEDCSISNVHRCKNEKEEPFIIDYVIIENQISPIANRMKTIQGMIAQYFIMKGNVQQIEFISAMNKLKDLSQVHKGEKMEYADRKKAGITKCLELLNQQTLFQKHKNHFQQHKKKDDLADCFLQGWWYILEKIK